MNRLPPLGADLFYHDYSVQHPISKSRLIAEHIKLIINSSKSFWLRKPILLFILILESEKRLSSQLFEPEDKLS